MICVHYSKNDDTTDIDWNELNAFFQSEETIYITADKIIIVHAIPLYTSLPYEGETLCIDKKAHFDPNDNLIGVYENNEFTTNTDKINFDEDQFKIMRFESLYEDLSRLTSIEQFVAFLIETCELKEFHTIILWRKIKFLFKPYEIDILYFSNLFVLPESITSVLGSISPIKITLVDFRSELEPKTSLINRYLQSMIYCMNLAKYKVSEKGQGKPFLLDAFAICKQGYVFYSFEKDSFYEYCHQSHGWEEKKEIQIMHSVYHTFQQSIVQLANHLSRKKCNPTELVLQKILNKEAWSSDMQNNALNILKIKFSYSTQIYLEFLESKNILRFDDGVLDVNNNIFRDATPGDFTMRYMGCSFDEIDQLKDEVEKARIKNDVVFMFDQLFPNPEVRHFMCIYLSSLFMIGNKDKRVVIFRGNGNNGKTLLTNILSKIWKQHINRPNSSQLTRKRADSSSPTSDWIKNDKVRMLLYQEMEAGQGINEGVVKFLTGNESSMTARGMRENERDIVVNAKVCISTNFSWSLDIVEKAVINRLLVIPFETTFVENPNPNKPNEKQGDSEYEEKICNPLFYSAFIKYIYKYYIDYYKDKKLVIPKKIQEATHDFIFIGDHLEFFLRKGCKTGDHKMSVDEFFNCYTQFINIKFPNKSKKMDIPTFMRHIGEKDIAIIDNNVYGYLPLSDNVSIITRSFENAKKSLEINHTENDQDEVTDAMENMKIGEPLGI